MDKIIHQCDTRKEKEITAFLKLYRKGEFLYPSVLKRNTKLSEEKTNEVLKKLTDAGFLERKREYHCIEHFSTVVVTKDEDQEAVLCPECDAILTNYSYFYVFL